MPKLLNTLSRTLRARDDDSASDPYSDELEGSSPSVLATGDDDGYGIVSDNNLDDEGKDGDDVDGDEEEGEGVDVQEQLSKVSFGALAKAQEEIRRARGKEEGKEGGGEKKRKRDGEQEDKLEVLRERLRELKRVKKGGAGAAGEKGGKDKGKDKGEKKGASGKAGKAKAKADSENDDGSSASEDSDSDSDSDKKLIGRTSKHAPAVQTSTKPVSRKRQILATATIAPRDPRFDPLAGALDANKLKHNYAFLEQYKEGEMGELRAAIKKSKNEGEKEVLKRKLLSMESQRKARERKEREEKVRREHMRAEREKVGEGKGAFYLKKSEQKKLALVDQFEGMKGKQRDRLIERRRKKATAKERKNMPEARRGAEE